jgi:hypothetical protein
MLARQSRTSIKKERPVFGFLQRRFLLAKHTRRSRLRARAGSHELGVALAEYAASLRFQTSAHPTQEGRREPQQDPERNRAQWTPDTAQRTKKDRGGACRDRTDDLKLAKLPLSQLS